MCEPISLTAALSLGATALSTGLSVVGMVGQQNAQAQAASAAQAQAVYQAQVARQNQQLMERQAADATQRGQVAEENRRRLMAQQIGQQQAGLAAQGTDLEGSPTDILGDTAAAGELDARTNIDRYIGEEANRRRSRARDLEGTGYGFLNFLAAAGLETATPHGLVGLFIPATRVAGAAGVARSFLGNVLKEGAFQAGANAALQAGAEGLDFLSRSQTGSAQTGEEIATNIAGAAVIGGALGAGLRALHLKWLGLPGKVRGEAPLEVKDAFRAIEGETLYSGKNRLGIDALLHERFVEQSMDPILRGRAPDFTGIGHSVDTPFTALGTVLRTVPDEVSVRGLEGLGTAMDRVRALESSCVVQGVRGLRAVVVVSSKGPA